MQILDSFLVMFTITSVALAMSALWNIFSESTKTTGCQNPVSYPDCSVKTESNGNDINGVWGKKCIVKTTKS